MKKYTRLAATVLAAGTLVTAGAAFAQDQDATQPSGGQTTTTTQQGGTDQTTTTTQSGSEVDKRGGSHEETKTDGTKEKKHKEKKHKASRAAMSANFANTAAEDGMAEVALGNLALQKAQSPAVKAFAQRMVTDHSQMNTQLQQVASGQNMTLPTAIDAKHQAEINRLQGLSGAEFDKAYMQLMVKEHKKDVSEFQNEASGGENPQVKALASQSLPTLQDHLRSAEDTLAQVKKEK